MLEVKAAEAVKVVVDESLCTKCSTCRLACPAYIFHQVDKDGFPKPNNLEGCIACGHCAAVCPVDAISHSSFPEGSIHTVNPSMLPSPEEALSLLMMRRSIRAFQNTMVEKELVDFVIEGAKFAPTASNVQDVEYTVVQDSETMEEVKEIMAEFFARIVMVLKSPAIIDGLPAPRRDAILQMKARLPLFEKLDRVFKAGGDPVLHNASNLLVFHAVNGRWSEIDSTLAAENAMLICSSLGLGSFYVGLMQMIADQEPRLKALLGIPADHGIHGVLAFGYPKYTFKKWMDKRPAKVTWITPGHNEPLAKFKEEEYRKNVEYWDNFSKNYDGDIDYDYGNGMRPLGAERLKKEGRLKKVVEFGCGTGYFTKVLLGMSDSVLVTDLSEKFLAIAREQLKGVPNATFGIADCERSGMPDNKFDMVFTGLLGNSIDTEKAYREFYRILKPGGAYITYTVVFEMLDPEAKRQLFMRRTSKGKGGAPNYRERSIEDYRASAEKAGFKVVVEEVVRDSEDALSVPFLYMKCVKPGQ